MGAIYVMRKYGTTRLRRIFCCVAANWLALAAASAFAQTASNTATVSPPAGVFDPACNVAGPACNSATDSDAVLYGISLGKSWSGGKAGDTLALAIALDPAYVGSYPDISNAIPGSSTSPGSTTGATANAAGGTPVRLTETFSVGSVTGYVVTLACNGTPVPVVIDAGSNLASATYFTPATGRAACRFTNTGLSQTLTKALTGNADEDGSGTVSLGDTLTYTVTLANTSTSGDLANVVVSDPKITPATQTCASVAPGAACVLTGTYVVTAADVAAGSIRNTAVATSPACPAGSTEPSCTTTIDTPTTRRVIDAVDDSYAGINGGEGNPNAGNAYTGNDTLNGQPVEPSLITGTVTTPATPINGGPVPTLDPAMGVVSVPAGTPAGSYTITYQICEKADPANCDTAIITVAVMAPRIIANDDTHTGIDSATGNPSAGNAYADDTLNGRPIIDVSLITGTVTIPATPINGGPVPTLDTTTGSVHVPPGTPAGTYVITYQICEVLNPTNCDPATITVEVQSNVELRVTKTAGVREVRIGDLVQYRLAVENVGTTDLVDGSIVDMPAAGFSYVEGSLVSGDADGMATASGGRPLRFSGLDVPAGRKVALVYVMRVGAGVRPGTHINQAQAYSPQGEPVSNVATAEVVLAADPLLDDSLVFGTVFNDRDGDGWQDSAELSGVSVRGGFAAQAYIAGSTTVDRGAGPQPQADTGASMLRGIDLGRISGRQSVADPVAAHRVVIRQRLRELAFTDDFVLTSAQGTTVRMDKDGRTVVGKSGDAAKGLNAAAPTVERLVGQGEGGYVVDYVISNAGIDERGIPGVRIASVEGLLIETDQFGRYHLAGVDGGAWERGRNFILKVDPSTLPAGAGFTTDNPVLRRATPGVPVRFDWGVKLPERIIEGGSEKIELEMGEVFFAPGSAEVRERFTPVIEAMAAKVRQYHGGEVVIQANADGQGLAFDRANAVKQALRGLLDPAAAQGLVVSIRAEVDEPDSLIAGVGEGGALLGTVLFDTDESTIRPQFEPLLDRMAAALERMGGGNIAIVGHTDVRASHAYNTALGLRRARAVHDALARRLSPEARAKVKVDVSNDPTAPAGARK